MPRKPPIECQRQHYSPDLKARVIYQYAKLRKSTTEISIDLDMPLRVVQRVLQTWQEIGAVCRSRRGKGRAPLMGPSHCRLLIALLEHSPDLFLDELQLQLLLLHGITVSLSTLWRTLRRLGYSNKKLSRIAAERSAAKRSNYVFNIGGFPADYLVFADEAAVNILTTYRVNGWSIRGLRARKRCNFVRGTRYSLLPAITTDGIIYSHVKEGGYNGAEFSMWLKGLMEHMNPFPSRHSVLVLDNCSIHHVEDVAGICEARGVKLVYLLPYSPDLNPIEECFSLVKHWIRRFGHEFRIIVEFGDKAEPFMYLYNALSQVTGDAAKGWFRHSGYM